METPIAPPPVVTQSLSQTYASTVQEDSTPDIEEVLKKLNLSDYSSKFQEEKVDTETLVKPDKSAFIYIYFIFHIFIRVFCGKKLIYWAFI